LLFFCPALSGTAPFRQWIDGPPPPPGLPSVWCLGREYLSYAAILKTLVFLNLWCNRFFTLYRFSVSEPEPPRPRLGKRSVFPLLPRLKSFFLDHSSAKRSGDLPPWASVLARAPLTLLSPLLPFLFLLRSSSNSVGLVPPVLEVSGLC